MASSFLYFAYGSNLLAQRIHINNPSAVRKGIGKLQNYKLDFNVPSSKKWGGCPASVVPHEGSFVWGAIWEIANSNIADLDRQEGVHENIYVPIIVKVESPDGTVFSCRSYQLCSTLSDLKAAEVVPKERLPSRIYMEVIISGAQESGLPATYIEKLKKIPHNGSKGSTEAPVKLFA